MKNKDAELTDEETKWIAGFMVAYCTKNLFVKQCPSEKALDYALMLFKDSFEI